MIKSFTMITSLGFKNYKAFASGEINFKPITILLGANSVGKSSIIQLILILLQSANDKDDLSALKLNGEIVSLGNITNIFRNRDTNQPVQLSIGLNEKFNSWIQQGTLVSIYKRLEMEYRNLDRIGFNKISLELKNKSFNTYIDASDSNFYTICNLIEQGYNQFDNLYSMFDHVPFNERKNEYIVIFQILKQINHIISQTSDNLQCLIELGYNSANRSKTNILYIRNISISSIVKSNDTSKNINILEIQIDKPLSRPSFQVKSDILSDEYITLLNAEFHKYRNRIVPNARNNIFSYFDGYIDIDFLFTIQEPPLPLPLRYAMDFFHTALQYIENELEIGDINYVSPLRAYPKRYYSLDKTKKPKSLDTLDGDSIAEVLKNNEGLKWKVNNWLNHFKVAVDVHIIEEVIHKLKVQQNNLQLDITDVGFGISQILPVIVQGFFTAPGSLTMIEQPEVHLHPKMQADLADLFIDIALPSKDGKRKCQKYLLIETHSEYLLKRLRRRIADKTISADDVGIYYIEQKESNLSTIKKIDIGKTGLFEWPEEFYGGELLKDTLDFLKMQNEQQ